MTQQFHNSIPACVCICMYVYMYVCVYVCVYIYMCVCMYVCLTHTHTHIYKVKWNESHSVMSDSLRPHGLYSPWNSPGHNTGVGSRFLLQGIFLTQGSNPGLPHCRWILYQLSHEGSPRILEWVAYPFSSRSSQPRNRTRVSWIAGRFFTSWATRDIYIYMEEGMATHSSTLAWRIPWMEMPGGPQSTGSQIVGYNWATNTHIYIVSIRKRKKDTCIPIFNAALLKIAKTRKQPKCPSTDERIKKMWYTYTMQYYSATQKEWNFVSAATWIYLESIMLSEISHIKTDKYCTILLTCGI